MTRAHNFSAGPAVLPTTVIEELREALPEFKGTGMGLMEISHRSQAYEATVREADERLRRVLSIPSDYKVIFQQGGASLQFYMSALNLLRPGDPVDFLCTGVWSNKAIKEAARIGDAKAIFDGKGESYKRIPRDDEYTVRSHATYLHYTTNNTIYGTQFHRTPQSDGKPIVADMSSDIASRPMETARHALIYAGAQKNLGPSGVTVVILSPWAMERSPGNLPPMLDYKVQVENGSMYNTPNTFGIFALERVLSWVEALGGPAAMARRNTAKADMLYKELDRTPFWKPNAAPDSRSQMNVTWRMGTEDLEAKFVTDASKAGLKGLKGHRNAGGLRASLYNALEPSSVEILVGFMQEFERTNG